MMLMIAACQSMGESAEAIEQMEEPTRVVIDATAVPTAGPLYATNTPTLTPTHTLTPTITLTPTLTATVTPSLTATFTPTLTLTPTLSPTPERMVEHFYLRRPIAETGMDRLDRPYAYGSTQNGTRQTHHGVEFQNPTRTPVLAAAGGTVIFAGMDNERVIGRQLNYYGNVVIIEHGFTSPDGLPIYTLYGHLDEIAVEAGQTIEQGERVGRVGGTGIAIGPHLHFEVRVGDPYDFDSTRNPDLWLYPKFDEGIIAGRVVNADGSLVYETDIQLRRVGSNTITYETYTYADDTVTPSFSWQENFTRGDLRAGEYEIVVSTDNGVVLYRGTVTLEPNSVAWIEIQLER